MHFSAVRFRAGKIWSPSHHLRPKNVLPTRFWAPLVHLATSFLTQGPVWRPQFAAWFHVRASGTVWRPGKKEKLWKRRANNLKFDFEGGGMMRLPRLSARAESSRFKTCFRRGKIRILYLFCVPWLRTYLKVGTGVVQARKIPGNLWKVKVATRKWLLV